MKTIRNIIFFGLSLVLFNITSCYKQEIPTGDHTFSCYIDGDLFVPKGSGNMTSTTPVNDGLSLLKYEGFFQAKAKDYDKYTLMFNIENWDVGSYSLEVSNGNYYNHSINHAMLRIDGVWYLSKESSGTITFIEADINGETSGVFEFKLYNENNGNDVVYITEGKFND